MKERILKLCKRLNKFTLDEIETISEIEEDVLLEILNVLIDEKRIVQYKNFYSFNKLIPQKSSVDLPLKFQFHSKEEIDYLIKGFCADVEGAKMMQMFNFKKCFVNDFNQYFRNVLYEKQKAELLNYFEKDPIIGQERKYMTATVYLYLYNNNLYVSEKLLKSKKARNHTHEERLEIKNIYLRSFRKVLSRSYAHKFYHHLAEEVWKYQKTFSERYQKLNNLIYCNNA